MPFEERRRHEEKLLATIKAEMPKLDALLAEINDKWVYEDYTYRFYHQSFKVYYLQASTSAIVDVFRSLAPDLPLNEWFMQIVAEGTGKEFKDKDNEHWLEVTRPILEAFFHARYFLEMICKYGKRLNEAPNIMPSGWAAVLYLYNIR